MIPIGGSRRMAAVQSPVIQIIGELVRDTPGAISLGQGMVYYGPPQESIVAAAAAMGDPATHRYGSALGHPLLLEQCLRKLAADNNIRVGGDTEVIVTAGGNLAFHHTVLAIADPGDEIILLRPYYFNHEMAVRMANCVDVLVDVDADYQPDLERIAASITTRTRAVVTVSPNNPSGAVYSEERLRAINKLCAERGIYHIHDEAYEYFGFDGQTTYSPASDPNAAGHTISLFSLSKSYGFAGWRIGYMVVPSPLLPALGKIQDTTIICPPIVSQMAAVAAMQAGKQFVNSQVQPIAEAREAFVNELSPLLGLENIGPGGGAFYLLLSMPGDQKPLDIATRLIKEFGIGIIPGDAFGIKDRCTLRVSYGSITGAALDEGLSRLKQGLKAVLSNS
ncbi:MAG: pyridoxal phosphate-dependent aminotransferase [Chthonomonadales bacterium]